MILEEHPCPLSQPAARAACKTNIDGLANALDNVKGLDTMN